MKQSQSGSSTVACPILDNSWGDVALESVAKARLLNSQAVFHRLQVNGNSWRLSPTPIPHERCSET
jgi:hypothetical protein